MRLFPACGRDDGPEVSILTRGLGRVRPPRFAAFARPMRVSILTRGLGRVRPSGKTVVCSVEAGFNPHPGFRPGATKSPILPSATQRRFNPHPGFRPGATTLRYEVGVRHSGFNPHPGFRPGATPDLCFHVPRGTSFNPHPGFRPGATLSKAGPSTTRRKFQSSPGV